MKKDISVGIIGTGFGKTVGLNFKAVSPSAKIFFTDIDKERLEKAVNEVGADGTFSSWQKLVKDPNIDLIVIASPAGMHKEMFGLAAQENKNILVEKPAALLSKDVADMKKSFKSRDKIAVVDHEGRFHPIVSYIKDSIKSGKLGKILTLRMGVYAFWYSNPGYKYTWYSNKSLGGGLFNFIGIHQIDLAMYLLGYPNIVSGSAQENIYQDPRIKKKITAETQFSAHFETKDKSSIQVFADAYCFSLNDFIIDVIGSKGIIKYSDSNGLRESFSNLEPANDVKWSDPMSNVVVEGGSIFTKSLKYMTKALIEATIGSKKDERLCNLDQEKTNIELFEKYNQS